MSRAFEKDPYPGKLRILFVGLAESTHTHSWIDLLQGAELNIRMFGLPSGIPPSDWNVKTYLTAKPPFKADPDTRTRLYSFGQAGRLIMRGISRYVLKNDLEFEERWLSQIIRRWRPDIIHTLGLYPAGEFYYRVRMRFGLTDIGLWVMQIRGGSDLTLRRLEPLTAHEITQMLLECDQLISDNEVNFRYAMEMGIEKDKWSMIGTVPGTGGVDVEALSTSWSGPPSSRRIIIWPKAYESPWSKALPVFEAIKLSWDHIQPCEIYMFAMTPEVQMWYPTLPEEIRRHCHIESRISREVVLSIMTQARIMLAPSLIDGTPNSMFEAMAAGAFPILSPIETLIPIVENERNVLFARNLYPMEIAEALIRAMSEDTLVDRAANNNLEIVYRLADRAKVGPRVIAYYQQLAERSD